MVDGSLGGETGSQGDGGDVLGVHVESGKDGLLSDGQNLSWVDGTIVEDLQDVHLVLEWSNLELVQKGGLTWGDLVISSDNLNWVDDLDLRLHNLGLNVKGLEERSLLWIHTSWTSWDSHICWGDGTDLGWGLSDLGVENLLDVNEITVGEDETSVQDHSVSDDLELWAFFLGLLISIHKLLDGLLHESVLSHDHLGVNGSELSAHDADLLGGNVIDVDEHALGELLDGLLGVGPNLILSLLFD